MNKFLLPQVKNFNINYTPPGDNIYKYSVNWSDSSSYVTLRYKFMHNTQMSKYTSDLINKKIKKTVNDKSHKSKNYLFKA
jgi:hypothetical protein